MGKKLILFLLVTTIFFVFPVKGETGDFEGLTIKKVEVEGNKRTSPDIIFKAIKSKVGSKLSPLTLREDLKAVYALGYFQDINIDLSPREEGVKVIFKVRERPLIERIEIEGNRVFKLEKIEESIGFEKGDLLSKKKVKEAAFKILRLYQEKGYYLARVKPSFILDKKENRAKIIFSLQEGKKMKIREIRIEGNKAFSKRKILRRMETRKIYRREIFEKDRKKILTLYHNEGYLEAKVSEPEVSFDEKRGRIYLKFKIEEGSQFQIGRIEIKGNKIFSSQELKKKMKTKEGEIFRRGKFEKDYLKNIPLQYEEEGYISARLFPRLTVEEKEKKINIFLEIEEGEIAYLEEIRIEGNLKTRDYVIRRELTLKEGDIYNGKKLLRSMQKIYNLEFFEDIEREILRGKKKGEIILVIKVKEQRTGLANVGVAYSTVDGFMGSLSYREINFRGKGQQIGGEWQFGGKIQNYRLSFTEPYLFQTPTSLGFDIYDTTREREYYTSQRKGVNLRLGRKIKEFNRIRLKFKYEDTEISEVEEEASEVIKEQEGRATTSSLTPSFHRDTRDNYFNPQKGYFYKISYEHAGGVLGGTNDFYKPEIESSIYFPSFWKFVLGLATGRAVSVRRRAEKAGLSSMLNISSL
jgi:outer membrane protein insertion porin family